MITKRTHWPSSKDWRVDRSKFFRQVSQRVAMRDIIDENGFHILGHFRDMTVTSRFSFSLHSEDMV